MAKRKMIGEVVSVKMKKTVVVEVETIKEHKKYRRRFKTHKKYKAHVEKGEFSLGDRVVIEGCKPFSKDKKWKVIEKLAVAKKKSLEVPEEEVKEEIKTS